MGHERLRALVVRPERHLAVQPQQGAHTAHGSARAHDLLKQIALELVVVRRRGALQEIGPLVRQHAAGLAPSHARADAPEGRMERRHAV
eukprot:1981491-Prymnesium_polylepis.2